MGHMHDEIPLAQFKKAVDSSRLPSPRGACQILSLKQLGRTHQHNALRHDAKTGFQVPYDKKGVRNRFRGIAAYGPIQLETVPDTFFCEQFL
jgi:hypothetical protein